jgi:hypothetical protein|tara:strand:+ start:391 stop:699 length:309 start_codon:yes stop_codon:yes gene_type:complete
VSISNVNLYEFHDSSALEEFAQYFQKNGAKNYPQAEILLFVKTGETSGISVSVYPNDEAREAASTTRDQKFNNKDFSHLVREISVLEGDVLTKHLLPHNIKD